MASDSDSSSSSSSEDEAESAQRKLRKKEKKRLKRERHDKKKQLKKELKAQAQPPSPPSSAMVLSSTTTAPIVPANVFEDAFLGTGNITTNQTIVKGIQTRFKSELQAKDGILIHKGKPDKEEFRQVRFVLSDSSLSLSTPFVSQLDTATPFHIIVNPHTRAERLRVVGVKLVAAATNNNGVLSREEMLDLRMKNKTDRMA